MRVRKWRKRVERERKIGRKGETRKESREGEKE
jgi:hypothetical protein